MTEDRARARRHAIGWLVAVAVVWGLLYLLGTRVAWAWTLAFALAGVLVAWASAELHGPPPVAWPSPERPAATTWFGVDPVVRRLARDVLDAQTGATGSRHLRERLMAETARRLVERHGADPADPLADAPRIVGEPAWALLTGRSSLKTAQIEALLGRIEEL